MSVTWHGLDEFLSDLERFADDLPRLPEQEQAGEIVAEAMRAGAPVRTGELAGSVRVLAEDGVVSVFPTARHAAPIIVGVPSHSISPHPFPEAALTAREGEVLTVLERGVQAAADRI